MEICAKLCAVAPRILIPIMLNCIFDLIKINMIISENIPPDNESKVVGPRNVPVRKPPIIVLLKDTINADFKPSERRMIRTKIFASPILMNGNGLGIKLSTM